MDRMDVEKWEVGAAFLPASVSYLVGTNVFGSLGHKMGRWRAAQTGLRVIGVSLAMVRLVSSSPVSVSCAGADRDSLHLAVMLLHCHNLLE